MLGQSNSSLTDQYYVWTYLLKTKNDVCDMLVAGLGDIKSKQIKFNEDHFFIKVNTTKDMHSKMMFRLESLIQEIEIKSI